MPGKSFVASRRMLCSIVTNVSVAGQIVADIERDYSAIRDLMNPILAEGSGVKVKKAMLETIKAVEQATAGLNDEAEGASAQEIAKALRLDKSAAWRRLSAARNDGFVVNLEQRRGMPGKYRSVRTKIEPEIDILPSPEQLTQTHLSQTPQNPRNRATGSKKPIPTKRMTVATRLPVARLQPISTRLQRVLQPLSL